MSPPQHRARRGRGVAAAAVALGCALALAVPPTLAPAGRASASTERVREAEEQVEDARRRVDSSAAAAAGVSARLDAAAARFEHALAHRLRLEGEEGHLGDRSDEAERRAEEARQAFARRVAATYMRPGAEVALAGAIALAPDANTALHRAGMIEHVALRERARADRARQEAALARDVQRQQQVVQAGVRGAVEDSLRTASQLEDALAAARRDLDGAWRLLSEAEAEHERVLAEERRRLEEEERRREAERRAAEIAARGSGPLPPVDGKVCPIGAPNAFIDSWGFPRSGGRRHRGVDIFAEYGMPLYAVADGVIARVWNNRLGGLSINLVDTDGHRYYYAHLSAVTVVAGQRVRVGETIGANGNSGNARGTPPHLHWQYHPGNGPPVNPYPLAHALCRR